MEYKVLIPSAGLGERLGNLSKNINKSLVTIYDKPAISYVIEKFPKNIEIVVALGYKGDLLKDFLEIAYPDRKITTVNIDNYQGPGSGLGYTILKCKEHLQCPFIFTPNDSVVLENIPEPDKNWMGYDNIFDNSKYRSLQIENDKVLAVNEKGYKIPSPTYIGWAGIFDYKEFWNKIESGVNYGSILIGESYGLREMIDKNIKAIKFSWFDTGSIEGINKTREYFKTNAYNILEKNDESIWFIGDKVIKYSFNKEFISKRIQRVKKMNGLFPAIIDKKENMYSYKFVNGTILSKCVNKKIFLNFLETMKSFWSKKDKVSDFDATCLEFYKDKTYKRVTDYFTRYQYLDKEEIINGEEVPKVMDLLSKINWDSLAKGIPSNYHGDLHFENILLSEAGNFVLLDWRENFGGIIEYGDIYYDLAKILHGIIVSHDMVTKDYFKIEDNNNIVKIDIFRNHSFTELETLFYDFLEKEGYDVKKVKILTALIYLNIAVLHHDPYSKFLFFLGKYMLNNTLNNE